MRALWPLALGWGAVAGWLLLVRWPLPWMLGVAEPLLVGGMLVAPIGAMIVSCRTREARRPVLLVLNASTLFPGLYGLLLILTECVLRKFE